MSQVNDDKNNAALFTYPHLVRPITWGKDGDINRQLITRIRKQHARIQNEFGAKIIMGGDVNFIVDTPREWSSYSRADKLAFKKKRHEFIKEEQRHLIEWLESARKPGDDDLNKVIDTRIADVNKLNLNQCIMARLQREFRDDMEFNFPNVGPDPRPFDTLCPTELPKDGEVQDYLDMGVPEFQIKPTDPVHAIERMQRIVGRAVQLGQEMGLDVIPATHQFHVSVWKEGKNITTREDKLPTASFKHILRRVMHVTDAMLPILYPLALHREKDGRILMRGTQTLRVTQDRTPMSLEATIRTLDNRFEFRTLHTRPPHAALAVSLITEGILQGLQTIEKNPNPDHSAGDELQAKEVPIFTSSIPMISEFLRLYHACDGDLEKLTPLQKGLVRTIDRGIFCADYEPPVSWEIIRQAKIIPYPGQPEASYISFHDTIDYKGTCAPIDDTKSAKVIEVTQMPIADFISDTHRLTGIISEEESQDPSKREVAKWYFMSKIFAPTYIPLQERMLMSGKRSHMMAWPPELGPEILQNNLQQTAELMRVPARRIFGEKLADDLLAAYSSQPVSANQNMQR